MAANEYIISRKIMAKIPIQTIRQFPLGKRALTHLFLLIFGFTMLSPFLWMLSTSLKTREQVFRSNWVPIKKFVKYNNKNIEVKKIMPAAEKPGIYKVKVISGPEKGRIIDNASTNKLTRISGKIFSYEARGDNGET